MFTGSRSTRFLLVALASAGIAVCTADTAAQAEPDGGMEAISPSATPVSIDGADISPGTIYYYGSDDPRTTRLLQHRLHLKAGPQGERFSVAHDIRERLTLQGPGELGATKALHAASSYSSASPGRDGCPAWTSGTTGTARTDVSLSPNASATLVATADVPMPHQPWGDIPWTANTFNRSWTILNTLSSGEHGTLPHPVTVDEPTVRLGGLRPATVHLRAGVAGSNVTTARVGQLTVARGRHLTLSGFITPAVRGAYVTVWQYAPQARRASILGVARVDRHGRFLYRPWRPRKRGLYELYATFAGVPGQVEAARSRCGGPQIKVAASRLT